MGRDSSPGNVVRVSCPNCKGVVFFTFKGGPHLLPCPSCDYLIKLEMVHDGRRWRIKNMKDTRRSCP